MVLKCVCLCYFTLQLAAMTLNKPPNLLMQTWRGIDVDTHLSPMLITVTHLIQDNGNSLFLTLISRFENYKLSGSLINCTFSKLTINVYCGSLSVHEFEGEDFSWRDTNHHKVAAALISSDYADALMLPVLLNTFWGYNSNMKYVGVALICKHTQLKHKLQCWKYFFFFLEKKSSLCVLHILKCLAPPGERAELAFMLTLCRRTESLVEINWRAGIFQTVSMSRGYLNASELSPLASVHTVIGTTPTFLRCIYGFLIATDENAEPHLSYVQF